MAKKKAAKRGGKDTSKRNPADKADKAGGRGARSSNDGDPILDLDAQNLLQWEAQLREREREVERKESVVEESERKMRMSDMAASHDHQKWFPNDMYEMDRFVHRAPSGWHLHTLVEMIVRDLIRRTRQSEKKIAWGTLAYLASKFRLAPKAKMPQWMSRALKEPDFLEVWDAPIPKRKRGGTGGPGSVQTLFTFVELSMLAYDKRVEWDDPRGRAERYEDADGYVKGYLPFAKELWEDGGWQAANCYHKDKGYRLRTNSTDPTKPKMSFGHFKRDIERLTRERLDAWRGAYPPT